MSSNTTTATEEIRQLVADLYDVFATGDPAPWTSRLSQVHEPNAFGTDPQEFWSGQEKLTAVVEAQVGEMSAAGISFRGDSAIIDVQGDVAWVVDQPTLQTGDGTEVPLRITIVFVVEGDTWRMAHFHLSAGVPNEVMLDTSLSV